jgi:CubicO group peptidase (beta-lactamase class C family)
MVSNNFDSIEHKVQNREFATHTGMFNNKKVLSENAIAEMLKNQYPDAKKRSSPELLAGFTYGMGSWIQEENANGSPNIVSAPGFSGTWPWIDFSKKYAAIIFEKNCRVRIGNISHPTLAGNENWFGGNCR